MNLLEEDEIAWCGRGSSANETVISGGEQYIKLQRLWVEKGMKTFSDYLVEYNLKDVVPLSTAINRMRELYHLGTQYR